MTTTFTTRQQVLEAVLDICDRMPETRNPTYEGKCLYRDYDAMPGVAHPSRSLIGQLAFELGWIVPPPGEFEEPVELRHHRGAIASVAAVLYEWPITTDEALAALDEIQTIAWAGAEDAPRRGSRRVPGSATLTYEGLGPPYWCDVASTIRPLAAVQASHDMQEALGADDARLRPSATSMPDQAPAVPAAQPPDPCALRIDPDGSASFITDPTPAAIREAIGTDGLDTVATDEQVATYVNREVMLPRNRLAERIDLYIRGTSVTLDLRQLYGPVVFAGPNDALGQPTLIPVWALDTISPLLVDRLDPASPPPTEVARQDEKQGRAANADLVKTDEDDDKRPAAVIYRRGVDPAILAASNKRAPNGFAPADVPCPKCEAAPSYLCVTKDDVERAPHRRRIELAASSGAQAAHDTFYADIRAQVQANRHAEIKKVAAVIAVIVGVMILIGLARNAGAEQERRADFCEEYQVEDWEGCP